MTPEEEKHGYHLLLSFLWQFHAFEEKLKAARFRKLGKPDEADWLSFAGLIRAGEIEVTADDSVDSDVVSAAMLHLSTQPLQGRSKNKYILHDTTQAAEVLQERGRQFMRHAEIKNFSLEDYDLMVAGLVVIPAWWVALDHWLNRDKSASS